MRLETEAAEEGASAIGLESNSRVVVLEKFITEEIGSHTEQRVEYVGPRVGAELREDGAKALGLSALAILIYVAFRFSSRFAPGAVVAKPSTPTTANARENEEAGVVTFVWRKNTRRLADRTARPRVEEREPAIASGDRCARRRVARAFWVGSRPPVREAMGRAASSSSSSDSSSSSSSHERRGKRRKREKEKKRKRERKSESKKRRKRRRKATTGATTSLRASDEGALRDARRGGVLGAWGTSGSGVGMARGRATARSVTRAPTGRCDVFARTATPARTAR